MIASAHLLTIDDAIAIGLPSCATTDSAATNALRQATGRADICISRRPSGRPRLEPPYAELGVSIAERGGFRVVAFSPTSRVGVDVEVDDPSLDATRLATYHFNREEAAWIASWPVAQRTDAFLRLWCVKEALLKITGRGVFDGVREPDLASIAARLKVDDAICEASAAADRRACHVGVRRHNVYVTALAIER